MDKSKIGQNGQNWILDKLKTGQTEYWTKLKIGQIEKWTNWKLYKVKKKTTFGILDNWKKLVDEKQNIPFEL